MSRAFSPADDETPRLLASSRGWRLYDIVCHRGPEDRRFEEQHDGLTIGIVLAGSFHYRSAAGPALLYPGAPLLGNPGACFECGHEHSRGDHCLSLHFDPDAYAEIAHRRGQAATGFRHGMLPALASTERALQPLLGRLRERDPLALEQSVLEFAAAVAGLLQGDPPATRAPSALDQRRLATVLHYMQEHASEALDLDQLAALACMSKYHFLRSFRARLGITPHQWLLQRRLARACDLIRAGHPIADAAYRAGFSDLSTFNHQFRRCYGMVPGRLREG